MMRVKVLVTALLLAAMLVGGATPAQAATGVPGSSGWSGWFGSFWDGVRAATGTPPATPSPQPAPIAAVGTGRLPVVLGLGDSVAAGDGLPLPSSPSSDEQLCRRSTESYVDQLAATRGLQPINLGCSGAGIWDGLQTDQEFDQPVGPTVKRTGQITMAQSYPRPEVITVSVGANSVAWYQWLAYCRWADCASGAESRVFRNLVLGPAEANLAVAVARLQQLDPGTVVLTGYYNPFAGDVSCLDTAGYSPAELEWVSSNLDLLNETIERVTRTYTNTRYAPVDFGDRGLCSSDPLVQGTGDAAPLHPTAAGQAVIAAAVASQLP